jgi:hypothetical protein
MCEFRAKRLLSRVSGLAALPVRLASWVLPSGLVLDGDVGMGLVAAIFLGATDGRVRLWMARTAAGFIARQHQLVISPGVQTVKIPWADVLAIETFEGVNRVDYVVVHYQSPSGLAAASCWEQNGRDDVLAFVRAAAARVNAESRRATITLAALRDQGVWRPLLERFIVDVAVASIVGLILGFVGTAALLGVLSASLSAGLAASRYSLQTTRLIWKDGLWWRAKGSETRALRVVPPSLRLWVDALDATAQA